MTAQRLDLIMATLMGAVLGVLLLFAHYYWVAAAWLSATRTLSHSPYPLGPPLHVAMQYIFARQWLRISLSGVALGGLTAYTWSRQRSDQIRAANWCLGGGLLLFMIFLVRQSSLVLPFIPIVISRRYPIGMITYPLATISSVIMNILDAALIWSLLLIWWGWTLHKHTQPKPP